MELLDNDGRAFDNDVPIEMGIQEFRRVAVPDTEFENGAQAILAQSLQDAAGIPVENQVILDLRR